MIPRIKHPITLSNLLKIKYNTQLFRRQKMLAPVLAFLFSCIYFSSTAQLRQVYIDDNEDNDTDMMLYNTVFQDADNYFVALQNDKQLIILKVDMEGAVSFFKKVR